MLAHCISYMGSIAPICEITFIAQPTLAIKKAFMLEHAQRASDEAAAITCSSGRGGGPPAGPPVHHPMAMPIDERLMLMIGSAGAGPN